METLTGSTATSPLASYPMATPTALFLVFSFWSIILATCVGWGTLILRFSGPSLKKRVHLIDKFWLGLSFLLAALQIWHFFLPIDWRSTMVFALGGVFAGFGCGAFAPAMRPRPSAIGLFFVAPLTFWLAYRGLDFPGNYDSGLYHFSSVQWSNQYKLVPGLANLHERLAFNQSFFLLVAWANNHPFFGEGHHVVNSLFCAVLGAGLCQAAAKVVGGRSDAPSDFLQCLLLPVLAWRALNYDISSPTPDLAIFIVGVSSFILLVRIGEESATKDSLSRHHLLCFLALCAAGCTIKLSFICYGVGAALAFLFVTRDLARTHEKNIVREWVVCVIVCTVVWGLPFLIRGIISSGYPIFPATILSFPVEWRLPLDVAKNTADWIASWSRAPGKYPGEVLGSWQWLKPWFYSMFKNPHVLVPLLAVATGMALAVGALRLAMHKRHGFTVFFWPYVLLVAATAFWFFTAPDPRFADWLFWLNAGWLLCFYVSVHHINGRIHLRRLGAILALSLTFVIMVTHLTLFPRAAPGFSDMPAPPTRECITEQGLRVNIPIGEDVRLWITDLPSAPIFKPDLALRGTSLAEGFKTLPKMDDPQIGQP